jgi:xylulokinase
MALGIGIDIGTTNLKVAVVDESGRLVGRARRPLVIARAGDTAEQDAEATWHELVAAIRDAVGTRGAEVGDLAVCSQYSSIVPVDANARPVAPMIMWQDQRGTDHSFEIMARDENAFMTFVEHHGIPPIGSGLSLGHILHFQLDRPDVHARTAAYLEAMDYVTARATGRITGSQHSVFMYQLCDNRTLGATHYDDDLVKLAGVDPTKLPALVTVDAIVGTLTPAVAGELGLHTDVRVHAGTNDTAAVAIATDVFTPGRAGLAIGTTSVLVDAVDDFRVDLENQIISMPGPFPDRYVVMAENGLGGKVVEHVLQNVVFTADELADHGVDDAFATLDATLTATEAGAGGVLFLPWLGGSNAPRGSTAMRGGFVHMSLTTQRRDLVRASVEGVAHNLGWLLPPVEAFTGESIEEIAFVGGAARSAPWAQILADVLDRAVCPLAEPDLAAARAMAAVPFGREHAVGVPTDRFEPDPSSRARYDARQVQFEAAYAALKPISEALHE